MRLTLGCQPGAEIKGQWQPSPRAKEGDFISFAYNTLNNPLALAQACLGLPRSPRICCDSSHPGRRKKAATQSGLLGLLTVLCDDPGHLLGCRGVALDLIAYHQPIHL